MCVYSAFDLDLLVFDEPKNVHFFILLFSLLIFLTDFN